jgi:putative Ca2+/H+ antiporter (TMEM165/GDT1 family)
VDPLVAAVALGTIFVVELPDKTFLATLVLSTKYRPLLVWLGVGLAFAVQTTIAVALGQAAATWVPEEVVRSVALVLFLVGAVILLKEGFSHAAADDGSEYADKAADVHGWKVVTTSFLVLFTAEWGDLSQLLTLTLVAKYEDPLSVWVGALCALLAVSGLAVLAGRTLLRWIPVHVLHFIGAGVCLLLATLTAWELLG